MADDRDSARQDGVPALKRLGLGVCFLLLAALWTVMVVVPVWASKSETRSGPSDPDQIIVGVLLAGLLVALGGLLHLIHRADIGPSELLRLWVSGIVVWPLLPTLATLVMATEDIAYRRWWTTSWYWMLEPLPVNIAGITGWEPAVDPVSSWRSVVLIVLQHVTITLVLGGLALVAAAYRQGSASTQPRDRRAARGAQAGEEGRP